MPTTWIRSVAASVLLIALVAACSDDGSDQRTDRSTSTTRDHADAGVSTTVDPTASSLDPAAGTSSTTARPSARSTSGANRSTAPTTRSTTKVVDRHGGTSEIIEGSESTVNSNETVSTTSTSTTSTTADPDSDA